MKKTIFPLLFVVVMSTTYTMSGVQSMQVAQARIEQFYDDNNNLTVSIEAPEDWNSGTASATIANLDWRGSGLATTTNYGMAFFAMINLPPIANLVLPVGQLTGLLSSYLSQYVSLNSEYEVTFTDGSLGHAYSISVNSQQLDNIRPMIPSINREFDAVLITTQHSGVTYIIAYATDHGRMSEFENTFKNIFCSVSFNETKTPQNGITTCNLSNLSPTSSGPNSSLAANGVNVATAELTILEGASVQGSPNYDPNSLTVRKGDKITVTNKDNVPHTVTSGIGPQDPTSAKLFDTSIIEAGATADIATGNIDAGNHPFYCSVYPYMTGTLVVDTLGSQESNNRKLVDSPYAAGQNVGGSIEEQLNLAREKVRAAQK